jgi:hypothetical protein
MINTWNETKKYTVANMPAINAIRCARAMSVSSENFKVRFDCGVHVARLRKKLDQPPSEF